MTRPTPTPPDGGGDDHEEIVRVPLPDGREVILDRDVWEELKRLGINLNACARTNSRARPLDYVKSNALLPQPDKGGSRPTHQWARLVVALAMLDEEAREGRRKSDARWRVEYADGDHLNLRRSNLRAVPAGKDQRGGFYELWDLRERRKLIAQGDNPNAIFAARRLAYRNPRSTTDE